MSCGAISKTAPILLLLAWGTCVSAQQATSTASASPSSAEVRFDFARTGLPVPKFTLAVKENGTGTYSAEDNSTPPSQQVQRNLRLTAATTTKIFALAHAVHPDNCASKAKNIADTGTKTLTYVNSGSTSSCTYNFTENKDVSALTDIFEGMAETMDLGRRLDILHRFDRLGLDDEIAYLAREVSSGRAIELGTIESSLRSIAGDAEVMQRVRTKAATLLALIPSNSTQK